MSRTGKQNGATAAFPHPSYQDKGMTLREYLAGQALTGLVADTVVQPEEAGRLAVRYADATLEELARETQ
jgi:hypothetical protein